MRRILATMILLAAAGCGFECKVKGGTEQFAGCDDLQTRFTQENQQPNPDNAALDDLDTCGAANGCNLKR